MSFKFYFNSAVRNIWNNKRQAIIYMLGMVMAISLVLSIQQWSTTAEGLAAEDFLTDQDYELRITTYLPEEIPEMKIWLQNNPLIDTISEFYYNLAFFNTENKPIDYIFYPEDQQQNMSDPVSVTSLALFPKNSLKRIRSQFSVRGDFDIDVGEVLISEYEAAELEGIYGYPIEPGMKINISVAKNSPELGEVRLYDAELEDFYNVTVKGIYNPIPSISMLQKVFAASFLKDSVIFLRENMLPEHIQHMNDRGIIPYLMAKCRINQLRSDGIDQILPKLYDFMDRLEIAYRASNALLLESPTLSLQTSYSHAKTVIVFMVPVIIIAIILSLFTTNIIIEKRLKEISTLKDRGAQKWQIIAIIAFEFLLLSLVAMVVAITISIFMAATIPSFSTGNFSLATFQLFLGRMIFPYSLTFYLVLGLFTGTAIFVILKLAFIFSEDLEEKKKQQREKQFNRAGIISLVVLVITLVALLGYFSYRVYDSTNNQSAFNADQTLLSRNQYLVLTFIMILLALIGTLILTRMLGKANGLFKRFFIKNYFFVTNSFKRSKARLTTLLIITLLTSTITVFSLNNLKSIKQNQEAEKYYNNGSDLRIQTTYTDQAFVENISSITGINEAMTVLKASGRFTNIQLTIYGVDALKYARIGRWDRTAFTESSPEQMMSDLNQTYNGVIISDVLSSSLTNKTIGSDIFLDEIPSNPSFVPFTITGVLHSAPGLGLGHGINLELKQENEEYIIINKAFMQQQLEIQDSELFFAKVNGNVTVEQVIDQVRELSPVFAVNPELINEQYVGRYIDIYIPNISVFITGQIIILNLIGGLIIATNLEFLLRLRRQNNAILNILGNSTENLTRIIFAEITVIVVISLLFGLAIGIPFTVFNLFFNRALFTTHNIVDFKFALEYLWILAYLAGLFLISLLATIPSIITFQQENKAIILGET